MYNYHDKQLSILNTLKANINKSLNKKPAGCLRIHQKANTIQYYHRSSPNQRKGTYIRKKDMAFIRALAQKRYDQEFLSAIASLEREMESSWNYYSMHPFYQYLASVYEDLTPARQKLVTPYVMPDEMFVKAWQSKEYTGKPFTADAPVIKTRRGERVRSKSEKMIADQLLVMGLPYRYEFPIQTKMWGTVYTDFTLLDLWNRQNVLLEHFGKMQDDEYCNHTLRTLEMYEEEGWHLGDNFLFTMESNNHIINMEHFVRLIRHRFPWLPYFSQ